MVRVIGVAAVLAAIGCAQADDVAPGNPAQKDAGVVDDGYVGDGGWAVEEVSADSGKCTPRPGDPCLGLDCTGIGDGFEHTYYKDLDGDGHAGKATVQACAPPAGAYTKSDDCDDGDPAVHPGAAEVCNGKDDDCNGLIDDGLPRVEVYEMPFSAVPPCSFGDMASCKHGAYDWCRAKSACFSGGFGPVELPTTSSGYFVCIGPGTLTGDFSDVTAAQPACASDLQASQRVCESAVHRAGRSKGHESAILQLHAPEGWSFLTLDTDRAKMLGGLWSELTAEHAGCIPARVDSWDCNAAVHRLCTKKGYVSGYGPVEYGTTDVFFVCVK